MSEPVLGIDVGGSGIKANLVDLDLGEPVAERYKVSTPKNSTPEAIADKIVKVVERFEPSGPIGCTFPGVVRAGRTLTAANVDDSWIGVDAARLLTDATGHEVTVVNDADAAGLAEMRYGAGRHRDGVVILLTFGTGIGSAMFTHGVLVPNTEFGHLSLEGNEVVEDWAAARTKDDEDLTWSEWAKRVDVLLVHLDRILSPDLIIVGGGVSRKFAKFADELSPRADVVAAELENEAGIVGAAMAAQAL